MDNVEKIDPCSMTSRSAAAMNHGGRFERADSGESPVAGRGTAFGDLNNDGWIDVVMTFLGGRPLVFLNHGGSAHWLTIALRGTRSNRDGFGARVLSKRAVAIRDRGGQLISSSDKRVHFGLGNATSATVEIRWPSGTLQTLENVKANQFLEIREEKKS